MKADLEILRALIKRVKLRVSNAFDYTNGNDSLSKDLREEVDVSWDAVCELERYLMDKEEISDRLDDIEGDITTLFQEVARMAEGNEH